MPRCINIAGATKCLKVSPMSDLSKEVQSPCIGVCAIDESTGFCQGCYRNLEEIQGWWDLDNVQKKAIAEVANQREAAVFGN